MSRTFKDSWRLKGYCEGVRDVQTVRGYERKGLVDSATVAALAVRGGQQRFQWLDDDIEEQADAMADAETLLDAIGEAPSYLTTEGEYLSEREAFEAWLDAVGC